MIKKKYIENENRFATEVIDMKEEKDCFTFTLKDSYNDHFFFQVSCVNNSVFKFELYRSKQSNSFTIINERYLNSSTRQIEAVEDNNSYYLKSSEMTVVIGKHPFSFKVINDKGEPLYEEITDDFDSVAPGENRIPALGHTISKNNGSVISANLAAKIRYNEHFYGMGEQFGVIDKLGSSVTMWNSDTLGCRDEQAYKNIPFYVSTAGYGMYIDSVSAIEFNFGTESNAVVSMHVPDQHISFYLISGTVEQIISTYMDLTGPAVMPPEWSFGLWYSTGFKDADEKVVIEHANKFRDMDISCDVFHFDCYWLREDKWCDFVWNDEMYPHKTKMLAELKKLKYKICLWINPYVTNTTDMYIEGDKRGYFVKTVDNQTYLADLWHGLLSPCAIVDLTNADAVQWFTEKLKSVLADGIDVLKTDFGENIPEDAVFANGKSGIEMRNVYSYIYNNLVYETIKQVNGEGIVWARSGTAGMQKFPVCWSGDPRSTYAGMAATLRGGLSIAMSGVPFWSHDMGGFYGDCTDDIYTRWTQFGLFVSHSRFHGVSKRQPWAFSEKTSGIVAAYINLRYQLMEYIVSTAKKCVERARPFIKPLVYSFAEPNLHSIWDQYMFGDSIIVAPVFAEEDETRLVYLPQGKWQDLLTKESYDGGKWYSFYCPIEYMPILKKAESDIFITCPDYIKQVVSGLPRAKEVI